MVTPSVIGTDVNKTPPAPPPPSPPAPPPPATTKPSAVVIEGIGLFILVDIDLKLVYPEVTIEYAFTLKIDPENA